MKLTDLSFVAPVLVGTAIVRHYRKRKASPLERALLEAANICKSHPAYAGVPVATLFASCFGIPKEDADLLLKPLLFEFRNIGVMRITGITDDTSLEEAPMQSLKLTDRGLQMLMEGALPFEPQEDGLAYAYDITKNRILSSAKALLTNPSPESISLKLKEKYEEIPFPEELVRTEINRAMKKGNKKSARPPWLQSDSVIESIRADEDNPDILWQPFQREVSLVPLGPNGNLRIQGIKDETVLEAALERISLGTPSSEDNYPELRPDDPDRHFAAVYPCYAKEGLMRRMLSRDRYCILHAADADMVRHPEIPIPKMKKDEVRVVLIDRADTLELQADKEQQLLRIKLPCTLVPEDTFFASEHILLRLGAVHLCAGKKEKLLPLLYEPAEFKAVDFPALARQLSKAYSGQDIRVLALLYATCQAGQVPHYFTPDGSKEDEDRLRKLEDCVKALFGRRIPKSSFPNNKSRGKNKSVAESKKNKQDNNEREEVYAS